MSHAIPHPVSPPTPDEAAATRFSLEDALHDTARGVSAATGDTFFRSLVQYLSRALRADYAFVAELAEDERGRVRTTAVCVDGEIAANIEYDLPGTPCADVLAAGVCSYANGVQGLFPDDHLLTEMGVEGYAGTPLFDSAGCALGLIVVLFRHPVHDLPIVESMLQVFAARAAAELERRRVEAALRSANEELEARVRERTAEMEKERALLEAVVRQMPAGLFIVEAPTGRLILASPQTARILRFPSDQLEGGLEDLARLQLSHADGSPYPFEEMQLTRSLRDGVVVENEEIGVLRGDGTRGVLLASSSPIRDEQGNIVAAVGTGLDITERKQTEEALRRLHGELEMQVQERTAELAQANAALQAEVLERKRAEQVSRGQTQALARTLGALTARPDLDTFVTHLVEAIRDQLQADSLGVELYDAATDRTVPRFSYVGNQLLTDDDLHDEWGVAPFLPAAEDATWQAVLAEGRPFAIYDVACDPRLIYREQFLRSGVRSVLVVPMLLGDRPVGYLFINHQEPRRYEPQEIELAQALAQQATLALQLESLAEQGRSAAVLGERERLARENQERLAQANAALEAEVRERRRAEQVSRGQTAALARSLNTLTARPDLDTFLGHLFQAICEQLQAHSVGVNLLDAARDHLVVRFASVGGHTLTADDLREWGVAPSLPAAQETLWQAVRREGRAVTIYDVPGDPRVVYREQYLRSGAQSLLVVPLLLEENPVGYLSIAHNRPHHYAPEEIELAQALAQQATLALQLTRLAEQGEETAVLSERNRLAREIHDTLAQGFAGILIHLQLAEAALTRKPERALPAVLQARDLAKSSLAEARRSVLALRPNALENESLPGALRKLVDGMTAGTSLRPRVEVRGAPCPLPPATEDHLLRIGQEALNNTLKYAGAAEVSVTLAFEEGRVTLSVRDDGAGFTPGERARGGGFGHVGMRERVAALRGELTIKSAPGQGAEVVATVPVACETGGATA